MHKLCTQNVASHILKSIGHARSLEVLSYCFSATYVLGQALIQLKFGRLQHCVQWTNPQDVSHIDSVCMECEWVEPGTGAIASYLSLAGVTS